MPHALPPFALSVRQPWAWAIIKGHKTIENRSLGSIRAGRMTPGHICLHAATGLTEREWNWGAWRLERHGVAAPPPNTLVRGAVIGTIEVTGIITESDSEWFGGEAGLTLANPMEIPPIPCPGELGYFRWQAGGSLAPVKPWMRRWGGAGLDGKTPGLFDDLPLSFRDTPVRPGGKPAK